MANAGFGRRGIDAVDGDVGKARLGSANLHIFTFAFVPFNGHTGQSAEGISHVGVGQTANHFRGKHLDDVIRGALAVDGLGFAGGTLRGDQNFKVLRLHAEFCLDVRGLAGSDIHRLREGLEPNVGDRDGVASRLKVIYEELTASVGNDAHTLGLHRNLSANQRATRTIGNVSGDRTLPRLRLAGWN